MKHNVLKAGFAGLLLSLSGLANAGLIELNSTTGTVVGDTLDFDGVTISLSGGGIDNSAPFADATGVRNSTTDGYPTANDIVFTFDGPVDNVSFSFEPWGLSGPGRGDLWVEVFNGATSLGVQEVVEGGFHTESLVSFGAMTSFVVNNGCSAASGDSSCSWISNYSSISFDPAQVPEPTTLAIFALGALGLASRRNKKQA